MTLEDKKRKLQKLLALSASPNKAEAEAAMKKCRGLMSAWGIRTIDVDEQSNTVGIATAAVPGQTKKHRVWESFLAGSISGCFDAECVIQRSKVGWNVLFISTISEQDIIVDLYKRLRRIISHMSKKYACETDGHAAKLQKAYAFGMIETINGRLITIYKDAPSTTALVVIKEEAIAEKMNDMFGSMRRHKTTPPSDEIAYVMGIEDGKHVPLSKSVGGAAQVRMI